MITVASQSLTTEVFDRIFDGYCRSPREVLKPYYDRELNPAISLYVESCMLHDVEHAMQVLHEIASIVRADPALQDEMIRELYHQIKEAAIEHRKSEKGGSHVV